MNKTSETQVNIKNQINTILNPLIDIELNKLISYNEQVDEHNLKGGDILNKRFINNNWLNDITTRGKNLFLTETGHQYISEFKIRDHIVQFIVKEHGTTLWGFDNLQELKTRRDSRGKRRQ